MGEMNFMIISKQTVTQYKSLEWHVILSLYFHSFNSVCDGTFLPHDNILQSSKFPKNEVFDVER